RVRQRGRGPAVGGNRPSITRPTVLLPEPLSPTRPTDWPRPTDRVTSLTACTGFPRRKTPRAAKCRVNPAAATKGSVMNRRPLDRPRQLPVLSARSSAGSGYGGPPPPPPTGGGAPPQHARGARRRTRNGAPRGRAGAA